MLLSLYWVSPQGKMLTMEYGKEFQILSESLLLRTVQAHTGWVIVEANNRSS